METSDAAGQSGQTRARTDDETDLGQLFERVTGTPVCIEHQEQSVSSRYLDEEASISAYVAATTANDGLGDAISDPDEK